MTLRDQLIADAGRFCAIHGISKSRLSTIALNNGKFFKQLEAGSDCTTGVFERFQTIFADPNAWEAAKAMDRSRRGTSARGLRAALPNT
jgi:hypothetical protein